MAPLTEQGTLAANYFSPVEKLENRFGGVHSQKTRSLDMGRIVKMGGRASEADSSTPRANFFSRVDKLDNRVFASVGVTKRSGAEHRNCQLFFTGQQM